MAVKLPDTLVPMADFPSAFAKDVQFTDGENLQDKLDKGKLGSSSSGTGLTEEQANNIEKIPSIEGIVTSNSQAIENKADKDHEHTEYLKEIPDEYVTDTELSSKGYATETFVTSKIAEASLSGGDVDLSGYATKDDIPTKTSELTNDSGFITTIPDIYALKTDIPTMPIKTSQLTNDSGFVTSIPEEYITETELEDKGYLTEHQSLADYAKKTDIPDVSGFLTEVPAEYVTDTKLSTELDKKINKEAGKGLSTNDLTNELVTKINSSATEAFVTNAIANAQLGSGEVDLSGYATVDALNLKADLTHTHDQYLTEVPDEYITETELTDKNYADKTYVTQAVSNVKVDLSGYAKTSDIPTKVSQLTNDEGYLSSVPSEYVTETELNSKGYLTEHQDISGLQPKTDDSLTTTDKTVIGAINEVNGNLLDTVGFSADYKNIILNRKNGLNPYTIPISAIINNTSLSELKDVDSTNIGNGKTLVYDSSIQKHRYVYTTGTDEFVKMDSTTDANYLSNLIDKSTVVNDNGVLKVKKLDGQEVTITEINYLKGLTMNVMDLVNAFTNGGVKVWKTPVNTYSDLETLDRSTFIDGISYIVYVLIDETHSNAKTTYLCTKTSTIFFGNADSQRNFVTNPIDLANEVTGKLGASNIDVDNLWTLLTINDTYKTLTTNNEIFGTHGAKAMYDELTAKIGEKENASDIPTKVSELINDSNYVTEETVNTELNKKVSGTEVAHIKRFYSVPGNDWNNAIEEGYYSIQDDSAANKIANKPFKYAIQVRVITADTNTAGYVYQIAYVSASDCRIYIRRQSGVSTWTDWEKICTTSSTESSTSFPDVPKTTLTPVFPGEVKVASGGAVIDYIVRNGWCNVNFAFNLTSATTFPWSNIATGLPKPANNANILLMDESGKINRTIAIKINSNGSVSSRIPVAFTAIDWWTGNISYPVAE